MKIGLDLRFLGDNLYSSFILELVIELIKTNKDNNYIIYTNSDIKKFDAFNYKINNVGIKNGSIKEQTTFLNILKKDNNNLMIFFDHYKPIFYSREYFILISSLKDIYYTNFSNYIEKYKYIYYLENSIKKSKKIICLDENTQDELIERFNIKENKIFKLQGFFPNKEKLSLDNSVEIDIKTKYNIKNDYFLYSGGDSIEKNYEKLISLFERLNKNNYKIDLIFLGDTISKNIGLRNLILEHNMQGKIHFMGVIKETEKKIFYNESLGLIFPSFYEPFPFRLTEPLYFNTPILNSDLKNIKTIFGDTITYFSPISANSIYETITSFIKNPIRKVNYKKIQDAFTKEKTVKQLLEII